MFGSGSPSFPGAAELHSSRDYEEADVGSLPSLLISMIRIASSLERASHLIFSFSNLIPMMARRPDFGQDWIAGQIVGQASSLTFA